MHIFILNKKIGLADGGHSLQGGKAFFDNKTQSSPRSEHLISHEVSSTNCCPPRINLPPTFNSPRQKLKMPKKKEKERKLTI